MNIENKTVWITGASSGIGEALAYELSKKNCYLILSARNEAELNRVKEGCKHQDRVKILPLDISEIEKTESFVNQAFALFSNIDIFVGNAGISQRSLVIETSMADYQKLMDVDFYGNIAIPKILLPYFVKRKQGHFVIVTSIMGKFSSQYRSGYCAAKHALHGFYDSLRLEHIHDNIKVSLICPGFVQTKIAERAIISEGFKDSYSQKDGNAKMSASEFAVKMVKAIEKEEQEAYIGKKEIRGVYAKRFFPKLLTKMLLRTSVT